MYTWETEFGILHSSGRRMSGYPANQTCMELVFPVLLYIMQRAVYRRKWLEGHSTPNHDLEVRAFIQWFCCVICEMRNWKTPLDRHLKCAFQITHPGVIWRTHGPKYCLSNLIQNAHFELNFKIRTLPSCENSPNHHQNMIWKVELTSLHELACTSTNDLCAFIVHKISNQITCP